MDIKYKVAIPEVLEYLNYLSTNKREKINNSFIIYLKENADYSAHSVKALDYNVELKNIKFSREAKIILTFIYRRFLCVDENQKDEVIKLLNENQKEYDKNRKDAMITDDDANKGKGLFSRIANFFKRHFKK